MKFALLLIALTAFMGCTQTTVSMNCHGALSAKATQEVSGQTAVETKASVPAGVLGGI